MTGPQIPQNLNPINRFDSFVQEYLLDEHPVAAGEIQSEQIKDMDFSKVEIKSSVFKDCIFHNCYFENGSFVDVIFQSCDFSNSNFSGAYFERCQFISCKCVGVNMCNTVIKQTTIEQSKFQYSLFDKTRITAVLFDHTDLTEVSMAESKLKKFEAVGSIFRKNNFFKTMLEAIDFTENEFSMPTVSSPPIELKGVVVNLFQAADLIGMWGVVIKQ
jgi:uncharacterized protein YjbI with pentapeptide repeats